MKTTISQEQKQYSVNRYMSGESVKSIVSDTGVARSTLYSWISAHKEKQNNDHNITFREFSANKRKIERLTRIIDILQKSPCSANAPLHERLDVIEEFSARYGYNVHILCEALKVAKGTYYNHILRNKRGNTQYEQKYAKLKPMIRDIHDEYNQTLGSAKIAAILKERGFPTDKKTVARLMSEMGLYSIRNGAKKTYIEDLY